MRRLIFYLHQVTSLTATLSRDLTSVSTTFSVAALACCNALIWSSSSLMASSAASRWRWTFSSSSCCSFRSCSSTQLSSSCRIWWRAPNSPLIRACRSAPTLCDREKWHDVTCWGHNAPSCFLCMNTFFIVAKWLGPLKLYITYSKVHISRDKQVLIKLHFTCIKELKNYRLFKQGRTSCIHNQTHALIFHLLILDVFLFLLSPSVHSLSCLVTQSCRLSNLKQNRLV